MFATSDIPCLHTRHRPLWHVWWETCISVYWSRSTGWCSPWYDIQPLNSYTQIWTVIPVFSHTTRFSLFLWSSCHYLNWYCTYRALVSVISCVDTQTFWHFTHHIGRRCMNLRIDNDIIFTWLRFVFFLLVWWKKIWQQWNTTLLYALHLKQLQVVNLNLKLSLLSTILRCKCNFPIIAQPYARW